MTLKPPVGSSAPIYADGPTLPLSDYGATGNGITDDSVALQAAIDAAHNTGGRITASRGATYIAKGLTVSSDVRLDLSGATLKLAAGTNAPLMTFTGARSSLRGGTIDGNMSGQTAYHYLVESTADDTTLEGVRFVNVLACGVRLRWNTKGHKVVRNVFDGPGVDSAVVVSSRNAVEVHSSHTLVALNTIRNIYQGHGVRVGRYFNTDPEIVENNLVAFNQFENIIDPLNESPPMKCEVNTIHSALIGNTVKNATRWLKMDACSHVTVAFNQIQGQISATGVNAQNCPFSAFIGNRLKDCGGGILFGNDSLVLGNTLENIGVGLESTTEGGLRQDSTESRATVAFNVLKNVRRFPILLSGSYGRVIGNRLEGCQAAASTAQIRVGGTGTVGGEISHNMVITPSSVSGTVIAFQGTGNKLRIADNTLDGAADQGVSIFTTANPYVAGNNVGDATTPINVGGGTTDPLIALNPGAPAGDFQTVNTDANFTLTALTSPPVTEHTGTLTANRAVTLTGGYKGARFRVARSGAGAFNLTVNGKNLATGQWIDVQHDGSGWRTVAFGSL